MTNPRFFTLNLITGTQLEFEMAATDAICNIHGKKINKNDILLVKRFKGHPWSIRIF
jgi:hypothetical protein